MSVSRSEVVTVSRGRTPGRSAKSVPPSPNSMNRPVFRSETREIHPHQQAGRKTLQHRHELRQARRTRLRSARPAAGSSSARAGTTAPGHASSGAGMESASALYYDNQRRTDLSEKVLVGKTLTGMRI